MELTIQHGKPNSPFFLVVYPKRTYSEPRIDTKELPIIELQDPDHPDQILKANLWDIWSFNEEQFMEMNGLARLAYGCTPAKLKDKLLQKFPELLNEFKVEYWLLKSI
jgi:hypothetical protein